MRCAAKSDTLEFVRITHFGNLGDASYPDWFRDLVAAEIIYQESCSGSHFYLDDEGLLAMAPGDVVLRNAQGQYRIMDSDTFDQLFYEVW